MSFCLKHSYALTSISYLLFSWKPWPLARLSCLIHPTFMATYLPQLHLRNPKPSLRYSSKRISSQSLSSTSCFLNSFRTVTWRLYLLWPQVTYLGPHSTYHFLNVSNLNPSFDFPTCESSWQSDASTYWSLKYLRLLTWLKQSSWYPQWLLLLLPTSSSQLELPSLQLPRPNTLGLSLSSLFHSLIIHTIKPSCPFLEHASRLQSHLLNHSPGPVTLT